MAQRQTERDTYGGERRWEEGAGASWTSVARGGAPRSSPGRETDPEAARWRGSNASDGGGGVLRKLTDELGITTPGPKGYRRSDERIREDVCERLWHEAGLDVSDVSVQVKDAVVTLEGTVPHRQMKHTIEDTVASCRGVSDVDNRLRVNRIGSDSPRSASDSR